MNIYIRKSQSSIENSGDPGIPSKEQNTGSFPLDGSKGRDKGGGYRTIHLIDIFDKKELKEISKTNFLMFAIENTGDNLQKVEIEIISESNGIRGFAKILLYFFSVLAFILFIFILISLLRKLTKDEKKTKEDTKKTLNQNFDVEELAIENHYPSVDKTVGIALLKNLGVENRKMRIKNKLEKKKTEIEEEEERCPLCSHDFKKLENENPKTVKGSKRLYHPLCLKRWVKKKKQCPDTYKRIEMLLAASIRKLSLIEIGGNFDEENNQNNKNGQNNNSNIQESKVRLKIGSKTSFFDEQTPQSNYSINGKNKQNSSFNFTRINATSTKNGKGSPRNPLMSPSRISKEENEKEKKFIISPISLEKLNNKLNNNNNNEQEIEGIDAHFKKSKIDLDSRRKMFRRKKPKTQYLELNNNNNNNKRNTRKQMTFKEIGTVEKNNDKREREKKDENILESNNMNIINKKDDSFDFNDIQVKKRSNSIDKYERAIPPRYASPQLLKQEEGGGGEVNRNGGFRLKLRNLAKNGENGENGKNGENGENGENHQNKERNKESLKFESEISGKDEDISIDESSFDL